MSVNHPQAENNTAPVQGQIYIAPEHYKAPEEEIDLRELFAVIWKGKWWIVLITTLFAIASVFYALSLPNEYRATAILAPASQGSGGSLNNMSSQIGALAAKYAGVSIGAAETSDTVLAIEIMKTWGFQEAFIKNHDLAVPIFATKGWNSTEDKLIFDEKLYDVEREKWLFKSKSDNTLGPSSWELHEEFSENLSISEDSDSGLYRVSYVHNSPELAQKISLWLVEDINALMKEKALLDASKNIAFLEEQISRTPLSGMQEVFYALVEEQTKTKMLANVSDEYVFKYVSKPRIPEVKSGPKRAVICIAGVLLGGFLSLVFLVLRNFLGNDKKD